MFESDGDWEAYLGFLKRYADHHGLAVWAYCLMSNHIHLIAVPLHEESLGHALHDAHTVYAMHLNARTKVSGHVWQVRFHSCPLDEAHLWAAVRCVERNPVRAGLVKRAEDYRWSSARSHCGLFEDVLLSRDFLPVGADEGTDAIFRAAKRNETRGLSRPEGLVDGWPAWLAQGDDEAVMERIHQQTHTGRPCGSTAFEEQLEGLAGRILRPARRGRKPKEATRQTEVRDDGVKS